MSTTTKLGIRVFTELGRTGGPPPPANWWDLKGIVGMGLAGNKNDMPMYFEEVLSKRVPEEEKDVKKLLREFVNDDLTQDKFLDSVFLDLSPANIGGNELPLEKAVGDVDKLNTGGSYKGAVDAAMACAEDGCKAYRTAILGLLRNRADVRVNAYANTISKYKKEYGQDRMPEKVKFHVKYRLSSSTPQIEALFVNQEYKDKTSSHARHVEILSGILFESGNVYCGNYGEQGSQRKETEVFVHNARQVIGIAKNYPITQTDWRNVMTLILATDIDIKTFKCTAMAVRVFTGSGHDVSSKMKVDYQ